MKSNSSPSRRDFLRLTSLAPASLASPRWLHRLAIPGGPQNVIVVVFDAWSAYNISLYGYARETTPNLARLAKRAIVYHNHFAGSNFTTSGTASLLTGTLPWTHRALEPNGRVAQPFIKRNLFGAFQDYYRVAYTHNVWALTLLRQLQAEMDELVPRETLLLPSLDNPIHSLFGNDEDIAYVSWVRDVKIADQGYAYSLFLSRLYQALQEGKVASLLPGFPRGLPTTSIDNGFLLEQAVDWLAHLVTAIPQPFFGYFHFFPPHAPYHTSADFYRRFEADGYQPPHKPVDVFSHTRVPTRLARRTAYDEFILYVDREFGRLYDALQAAGVLENTWVILTSDHGEMFERGIIGHWTEVLYQPVIRIPLMIFEPGRDAGMDIQAPTSAVDVLPTLAQVTGHALPDWTEGVVLPPYADTSPHPTRTIYATRAAETGPSAPLTQASTMLLKGRYKLHYYFGYYNPRVDALVKLYDIEADPEELFDLSSSQPEVAGALLAELKAKLAEVNRPYL